MSVGTIEMRNAALVEKYDGLSDLEKEAAPSTSGVAGDGSTILSTIEFMDCSGTQC